MPVLELKKIEAHPAGEFLAQICTLTEETSKYGDCYKIGLKTEQGTCVAMCSATYSEKSKFGKLVAAAFGNRPQGLNTDDLLNQVIKIKVIHTAPDDDGNVYDRVIGFAHRDGAFDPFENE